MALPVSHANTGITRNAYPMRTHATDKIGNARLVGTSRRGPRNQKLEANVTDLGSWPSRARALPLSLASCERSTAAFPKGAPLPRPLRQQVGTMGACRRRKQASGHH